MNLDGTYIFDAPREAVWQALLDPIVLARVMPGCEKLEQVGDNEYKGMLKIRVGPVQGQFEGLVNLTDIKAPESYRMQVDGKGAPGFMKGVGEVRLEDQGASTLMHYSGEAQVGGRIASVGQRLLESSAKALTRQSLDGLHDQIKARIQPPASLADASSLVNESTPAVGTEAPSQIEFVLGVAKHLLDDLVPAPQRPKIMAAALVFLSSLVVLNWWMNGIARKAAQEVWERRGDY